MKKLVFMFAAIVAVSFASCGNKAEAPVEEAPVEEVADSIVEAAADSVVEAADSVVAEAAEAATEAVAK